MVNSTILGNYNYCKQKMTLYKTWIKYGSLYIENKRVIKTFYQKTYLQY